MDNVSESVFSSLFCIVCIKMSMCKWTVAR